MDRRLFLQTSTAGIVDLVLTSRGSMFDFKTFRDKQSYSIVMLGDTHFDADPSVYHSKMTSPSNTQKAEFTRNANMWKTNCPSLVNEASNLIDESTQMVFQVGDLVQGDCGDGDVHKQMLTDAWNFMKPKWKNLPFVTCCGNHDVRGTNAQATYQNYMPTLLSGELDRSIINTNFCFSIGPDAFIILDVNKAVDDDLLYRMLQASDGARYVFIMAHAPFIPADIEKPRWLVLHGNDTTAENAARRELRAEFAKRNVIYLCGHIHTTEFLDWEGDGGRITQMTMNSVWDVIERGWYIVANEGISAYGQRHKNAVAKDSSLKDESALFAEYQPGVKAYSRSYAAGSYKLNVSPSGVNIELHAGNSSTVSHTFNVR